MNSILTLRSFITRLILVTVAAAGILSAQVVSGQSYIIQAAHSGKVLDVYGAKTANGSAIVQWPQTNGANQQFRFINAGNGYFSIQSVHSGKMVDVSGASRANGARLIIWPANGQDNQKFRLQSAGGGYYFIIAKHSNKVVDVSGVSVANGTPIQQWQYTGGNNQRFRLIPVGTAPRQPAVTSNQVPQQRSFRDAEQLGLYVVQQYISAIRQGLSIAGSFANDPYLRSTQFRNDARDGRFGRVAQRINYRVVTDRLRRAMQSVPLFVPKAWSLGVAGGATFIAGGSIEGGGVWDFNDFMNPLGYLTYSYEFGFAFGGDLALTMGVWFRAADSINGNADAATIASVGSRFGIDFALWLDPSKYDHGRPTLASVLGFTFSPTVSLSTAQATQKITKKIEKKLAKKGNKAWALERARTHLYRNGVEVPPILPNLIDPRTIATAVGKGVIKGATVIGKGTIKAANATNQYFNGTPKKAGKKYITVFNQSGYVARFFVDYYINGRKSTWKSGNMALGHKLRFEIPPAASGITVRGQAKGIKWSKIFKRGQGNQTRCWKVYGTVFSPKWNNNCN